MDRYTLSLTLVNRALMSRDAGALLVAWFAARADLITLEQAFEYSDELLSEGINQEAYDRLRSLVRERFPLSG